MENVILIIHLILALAIIFLVLIQRSEGGGLGIGGSSGGGLGGFASPKGTASALTRMTAFAAACFFATSLLLAILAGTHSDSAGILDTYQNVAEEEAGAAEVSTTSEIQEEVVEEDDAPSKPSVPIRE